MYRQTEAIERCGTVLRNRVILSTLALASAFLWSAGAVQSQQSQAKGFVFNTAVDKNTVVRFFYQPPGDYFHYPLVFRAVEEGDSRLGTGPSADGGIAYIVVFEMQQLSQGLAHLNLSWQESEKIETLESFKDLPITDRMEIVVVTSKGTAKAQVKPNRICETLGPLDSAIRTKRPLWGFQAFRINYGCKIPGFKPGAYPDAI